MPARPVISAADHWVGWRAVLLAWPRTVISIGERPRSPSGRNHGQGRLRNQRLLRKRHARVRKRHARAIGAFRSWYAATPAGIRTAPAARRVPRPGSGCRSAGDGKDRKGKYPVPVTDLEIKQTRFGAPAAQALVAAAQADLAARYGSGDENPSRRSSSTRRRALPGRLPARRAGRLRRLAHAVALQRRRRGGRGRGRDQAHVRRARRPAATGSPPALLRGAGGLGPGARHAPDGAGDRWTAARGDPVLREAAATSAIANYGYYKDEPDCVSFGRDL